MRALGPALALVAMWQGLVVAVAFGIAPARAGQGGQRPDGLLRGAPAVFGVAIHSGEESIGNLQVMRLAFAPQLAAACSRPPNLRRDGREVPCAGAPTGSHACPVCSFVPLPSELRHHIQALSKCRRCVEPRLAAAWPRHVSPHSRWTAPPQERRAPGRERGRPKRV